MITDSRAAAPRPVVDVVRAALRGGATAVQLRDKQATTRELVAQASMLREITREGNALFFVNDRFDVALAVEADGVHLGPNDLPVSAVRKAVPEGFLIGFSTDDPDVARAAEASGADYIGCGAVFPTSNKSDAGEVIGTEGLQAVVDAVSIPVIAIGGIDAARSREVAATGAVGCAVIGAIMSAADPAEAARALVQPFRGVAFNPRSG